MLLSGLGPHTRSAAGSCPATVPAPPPACCAVSRCLLCACPPVLPFPRLPPAPPPSKHLYHPHPNASLLVGCAPTSPPPPRPQVAELQQMVLKYEPLAHRSMRLRFTRVRCPGAGERGAWHAPSSTEGC